jgi:chemotaxis protein methyltransferase CheR
MNPAPAVSRRKEYLVDGEFPLTKEDFQRIVEVAHADAGIDLCEAKASLVYSRLTKRLRALRLENFKSYCDLLSEGDASDERQHMVAALTTNVTRFFREPHHFEHLKTHVLPALVARARAGKSVRIWSAACSSGEEPYSIALAILSAFPDAGALNFKILATDIDPNVLQKARAGEYADAIMAPVTAELRRRWFVQRQLPDDSKGWQVTDELRKLVAFRQHNLMGPWPMRGPFDAIFCRNAVIYFREEAQVEVWCRFARLLAPGGRLYVGHSERLFGEATSLYANEAITTYRLRGEPQR